eukprot:TRINITY_DN767_c0_g1_i1.p1 TRINITY_DN767_c0_g1~~TRINITY_DN767_c0_g1_i1.p1  ORF type:complete len:257 (+),score=56.96 TRINITY_DN767_c0_g1_i1:2115-2885(+)
MTPVITMILSAILGLEIINMKTSVGVAKVSGIFLAVLGAGTMIGLDHFFSKKTSDGADASNSWAHIFYILNDFFYSVYMIMMKPIVDKYPTIVVTFWAQFFGACFSILPTVLLWGKPEVWEFNLNTSIGVLYSSLVSSCMGFYLMAWGNKKVSSVVTTAFIAFQPVATTILSAILLGTVIVAREYVGAACIILGLLLVCWAKGQDFQHQKMVLAVTETVDTEDSKEQDKKILEIEKFNGDQIEIGPHEVGDITMVQ